MMMLSCKKKFKLETVNLGLKMFQKNKGEDKSEGKYRLLQQGLDMLIPHLDERRFVEASSDFFTTLAAATNKTMTFDQIAADCSDLLSSKLKSISKGSAVLKFYNSHSADPNYVTIWIGRNNVTLMVGKEEIKSLTMNVGARE